jgi:hypothetical protein
VGTSNKIDVLLYSGVLGSPNRLRTPELFSVENMHQFFSG